MEIQIEVKKLHAELSLALSIVESKATIPILSNLLLRAEGNEVEIAATDLEVTFKSKCPAEVIQPGAITVPARRFGAIVRAFLNEEAPLVLKTTPDQKLFLQPAGQRNEYHLQTLPEEDFPALMTPSPETAVTVDTALFRKCAEEVLISAGNENSRFSVRGALMEIGPDGVTMVATDSHRLTCSSYPMKTGVDQPVRVLVPKKTLVEVLNLEGDNGLNMWLESNHIFFELGPRLIYSRLLDTTFPAYEKVIAPETDKVAVVDKMSFLERVKRVAMVAESKNRAVVFSFDAEGKLEMSVRNPETGDEGKEYEACESFDGEAVTVGFNVDFVIEFLNVCKEEKISIKMKDPEHQSLFEPVLENGEGSHKYVVMPLRLD
ncbi:MAG: DNA polymerase III subunit beta [Acidobacteriota bacterium]|jgi:DNA polymerase III subunit beta